MPASRPQVSIIIPTYNESPNILNILRSISESLPRKIMFETIVVDDNSPDGTGSIVDEHIANMRNFANHTINIIHRKAKQGLSSAVLSGIQQSAGDIIVVMDSDMSHPPSIIPKLLDALKSRCDLAIASRYTAGGMIRGWNFKRKLISRTATGIAKKGLGIDAADPLSGFFAFNKRILSDLKFDAIGYKILLEILVKAKEVRVAEIPYTFTDRREGSSKMGMRTMTDYVKSVYRLYRYGKPAQTPSDRKSARFLSKAARFFTVGASGLLINYLFSLLFAGGIADLWYLHANVIGIITSMTSNFVLNKTWTFSDRDFGLYRTLSQYARFVGFSSMGALIQLGMVFYLVNEHAISYPVALVVSVMIAAFGNYILNKKWTFRESVWG